MSRCAETYPLPREDDTKKLAEALAKTTRQGTVYFLKGDLGSGKTTFARYFIRALMGPDVAVPSPTFTLVQTYETPEFPLWHVDLYRVESPEEVLELGLDEAYQYGVSLIEWPDRLGRYAPQNWITIHIKDVNKQRVACIERETYTTKTG